MCSPDLVCPDGFVPVLEVNSCYKLITEVKNWADASKMCQNISPGVHLANIFSKAESEAVMAFFESYITSKYTSVSYRRLGRNNCEYETAFLG